MGCHVVGRVTARTTFTPYPYSTCHPRRRNFKTLNDLLLASAQSALTNRRSSMPYPAIKASSIRSTTLTSVAEKWYMAPLGWGMFYTILSLSTELLQFLNSQPQLEPKVIEDTRFDINCFTRTSLITTKLLYAGMLEHIGNVKGMQLRQLIEYNQRICQ